MHTQGFALVGTHLNAAGTEIVYSFPESQLPLDVAARFTALFNERVEWTFEEIEPYIR
jgi:hypothetical protein